MDGKHETNWKRSADRADSHITPHLPLSPWPTGGDVMVSFLKWSTINSHWGSQPVCCWHSRDRSCLKCFVILLAPLRLWRARHKYRIGGEFKIMSSPKQLSSEECVPLYDTNTYHMCLRLSGRLACFASVCSNQSGSCSSAEKKIQPKLPGQCFLHFQQLSRKLPRCPHSGHNARRSAVRKTCVWPPICCLARR